jgi:hypothetical protein
MRAKAASLASSGRLPETPKREYETVPLRKGIAGVCGRHPSGPRYRQVLHPAVP